MEKESDVSSYEDEDPSDKVRDLITEFSSYSKESLIKAIKVFVDENKELREELEGIHENNMGWSNKVLELENEVARLSSVSICNACSDFKLKVENLEVKNKELHECLRVEKLKPVEKTTEVELNRLRTRIEELVATNLENEKKLYSLRFVKEKTGTDAETKEKVIAMQGKLQSSYDRNRYLQEKVNVLEGDGTFEKPWFVGQKAHHMWLKQATRNKTEGLGFSSHKGESSVQGAQVPKAKRNFVKKKATGENLRSQGRKAQHHQQGFRNQHSFGNQRRNWNQGFYENQRFYGNQMSYGNQAGNWNNTS